MKWPVLVFIGEHCTLNTMSLLDLEFIVMNRMAKKMSFTEVEEQKTGQTATKMPRYRYIDIVIFSVIIYNTIMYSFIHYGRTRSLVLWE